MEWETRFYKLDGRTPIPCESVYEWAQWFEDFAARKVDETKVGDVTISTVFLGIDHNFANLALDGPPERPLLFETMVFGGELDGVQDRYSSWVEAQQGHNMMVRKVAASEQDE